MTSGCDVIRSGWWHKENRRSWVYEIWLPGTQCIESNLRIIYEDTRAKANLYTMHVREYTQTDTQGNAVRFYILCHAQHYGIHFVPQIDAAFYFTYTKYICRYNINGARTSSPMGGNAHNPRCKPKRDLHVARRDANLANMMMAAHQSAT